MKPVPKYTPPTLAPRQFAVASNINRTLHVGVEGQHATLCGQLVPTEDVLRWEYKACMECAVRCAGG